MPISLGLCEKLSVTDTRITSITADGGLRVINPSPFGGMWAFRLLNAAGEPVIQASGIVLPAELHPLTTVQNNLTEVLALLIGLEYLSDESPVLIRTDSLNAIRVITEPQRTRDWLTTDLNDRVRKVTARVKVTGFELLAGHPKVKNLALMRAGIRQISPKGYPYCLHNHWCHEACVRAWQDYETAKG